MTLPLPNLDDRTFEELLRDAKAVAQQACPDWADLSVHDPGVALLEAFAFLTEALIYRVNRLPERAYVAFLNLLGIKLAPPAAATTELVFSLVAPAVTTVTIPRGTRVTIDGRGPTVAPVFITLDVAKIDAGTTSTMVTAAHITLVEAEPIGEGSGLAGAIVRSGAAPIAVVAGRPALRVAIEQIPAIITAVGSGGVVVDGSTYEFWSEVDDFAGCPPEARVWVADLVAGSIRFAPAGDDGPALGAVVPNGRRILAWYANGGGPHGNVAAGTLTVLKDALAGVSVTNPKPATGGRSAEDVAGAIRRGPDVFRTNERAVTARDYEVLALRASRAVERARAFTRAETWTFAQPGEVEVVLVPSIPAAARPDGRLPLDLLSAHQTTDVLEVVERSLAERRPLGTRTIVGWAKAKSVRVRARVVVRPEESLEAVKARCEARLYGAISPLAPPSTPSSAAGGPEGWRFGQSLQISNVYGLIEQSEPGVRYVENVLLCVDDLPDHAVAAVEADSYQPACWFAAADRNLFRSLNDGAGWESVGSFDGEVTAVIPHQRLPPGRASARDRPGLVAAVVRLAANRAQLWASSDLGEKWRLVIGFEDTVIADAAWGSRGDNPTLYLATPKGLFEIDLREGSVPQRIDVGTPAVVGTPTDGPGMYAVATMYDSAGHLIVAAAAEERRGVFLTSENTTPTAWQRSALADRDIRTMFVEYRGPTETYLWALFAGGGGCGRLRIGDVDPRWQIFETGWTGGTCWAIAVADDVAFAATQSGGVLRIPLRDSAPVWRPVDVNCGLPLESRTDFEPVRSVAISSSQPGLIIVGGPKGVYRSADSGVTFSSAAERESRSSVTVPATWLLCSGTHELDVVHA